MELLAGLEGGQLLDPVFECLDLLGVYNVSGWSENVLSFIEHAENPKQVIDEIDAFEPA